MVLFFTVDICAQEAFGKPDPKTLVLVICSDGPMYNQLQKIWRAYMHLDREHFECYFIRANPDLPTEFLIEGDTIWSKGIESVVPGLLEKTIASLDALSPRFREFDYLLRANLTSFFVFPKLLEFLKKAPQTQLYCGIHHCAGDRNIPSGWICGAGIILSMDLVKWMLTKEPRSRLEGLSNTFIDDLAIARLFFENAIPITPGTFSREIYTMRDWEYLRHNMLDHVFHFRCWTPGPNRVKVEPKIHRELLNLYYPEVSID